MSVLMDMSDVVAALSTDDLVVTRPGPGSFLAGRWVPGASSTLTVRASVQPLTPRELLRLDEGLRARARFKAFARTTWQVLDQVTGLLPDRVTYAGEVYEVHEARQWIGAGGYHVGVLVLVDEP